MDTITYVSNAWRCFKVKFEMFETTSFRGVGSALQIEVSNNEYKD